MEIPVANGNGARAMPTIIESREHSWESTGSNTGTGSSCSSVSGDPMTYPRSRRELTVDGKWKVEEQLTQKESKIGKHSALTPILKWIATVLLGAAILCLFSYTRLSFMSLSWLFRDMKPDKAPQSATVAQWSKYVGQSLVIYLVLSVPYFLLLVRACWMGLFTRTAPWPRATAIFWCVLTGVLEPLGLVLLAFKVIPLCDHALGVLITGTSVVVPVLCTSTITLWKRRSKGQTICGLLALIMVIGGFAIVISLMENNMDGFWQTRVHVWAAIGSLNVAWIPQIQVWCTHSSRLVEQILDKTQNVSQSSGSTTFLAGSSSPSPPSSSSSTPTQRAYNSMADVEAVQDQLNGGGTRRARGNASNINGRRSMGLVYEKATWKASVIIYLVKLLATFCISFAIFYLDSDYSIDVMFNKASMEAFQNGWSFAHSIEHHVETWVSFTINIVGAFICYVMVFIVCHTNMHIGGLGVPLLFSLPLSTMIVFVDGWCDTLLNDVAFCAEPKGDWYYVITASVLLSAGQLLAFWHKAFPIKQLYLQKEKELLAVPGYQGAILDPWLLLDKRHCTNTSVSSCRSSTRTRVYICTTMYREDESEMRQLLESLRRINVAQAHIDHFFESHIILDGGVIDKNLSDFALQLISLLEETLGIKPACCTKIKTPYGIKLNWELPAAKFKNKQKMTFSIHLKDNTKVKNKKRWSQIMYMSYVLDFLTETVQADEECYILTTDADVMFTAQSVEALLDLMQRDNSIGAVCARTHPMGIGPLVWYQTFEYAVGHWMQKSTEHVLGSVLCAPGCFSVYRCHALRDILPKYCKKVESAFDFLTKDMGEDRWLCTLMVQSGWRIEYCAASENSTNCPSEFEEFYKQRRRWIASTLANLMLIIREWKYIALFNQRVSVIFLVYQGLLLFSTLIGPSTVILVVSGGLTFSWDVDPVVSVVLQVILSILFSAACVMLSPKTHLQFAKAYTFLYATLMCAVVVGTAVQIVTDLDPPVAEHKDVKNGSTTTESPPPSQHISMDLPVSVTTIYFAFLASMFVLAGLLHPRELYCLFHSLWYLLCLPSAYLVLMIYSICNLTDSSWGTREGTTNEAVVKKESWHARFKRGFYQVFFCCSPPENGYKARGVDTEVQTVTSYLRQSSTSMASLTDDNAGVKSGGHQGLSYSDERTGRPVSDASMFEGPPSGEYEPYRDEDEFQVDNEPVPVEEWLPFEFKGKYAELFKRHGFDNTLFLKGVTEKDLNRMGITMRGHVQFLLGKIAEIPAFDIEHKVPSNARQWLEEIGLPMYASNFRRNQIRSAREMEILKRFDRKDIERELGINKEGHIKRMLYAIRMLKEPTEGQLKIMGMRQVIEETPVHYLKDFDIAEFEFWNQLKEKCLEPDLKAFGIDAEIKVKLVELRNNWLMIMGVSNILWLILISTLASKGELTIVGANALGLIFLFIYSLIFIIQCLCMIVHRVSTMSHYLARASYRLNKPLNTQWSFKEVVSLEDSGDENIIRQVKIDAEIALHRASLKAKNNMKKSSNNTVMERTPLLSNSNL